MENRKLEFSNCCLKGIFLTLALFVAQAACASVSPKIDVPLQPVVEGGVFFVSVQVPEKTKNVEALFNNHLIEFYPDGKEKFTGFIGVDIGAKEGKNEMLVKIRLDEREVIQKKLDIEVKKGEFLKEVIVVKDKHVRPTTKAERRQIKADAAFLNRMYAKSVSEKLWDAPIQMPIESAITAPFGTSRIYKAKKNKKIEKTGFHRGLDLKAIKPTPIHAPFKGIVVAARFLYYTGHTVILDHGFGFFSIYAHLSERKVKEGQTVDKGSLLGLTGATGRVDGPHLHWGMKLHGTLVDPVAVAEVFKPQK